MYPKFKSTTVLAPITLLHSERPTLYTILAFLSAIGLIITGKRALMIKFVVVALLFYVHGKHLRSFRDGQLT